jgi:hypothetical protein
MDSRLIKNINEIDNIIDKLTELQVIEYTSKVNNKKEVGLISQELQKDFSIVTEKSLNNYLIVNYEKLIPFLIQSIKELKAEIDDLKANNKGGELIQQTPKKRNYAKKKVL